MQQVSCLRKSELMSRWDQEYDELEKIRPREPFQRDYARLLYSSAFRRLQGKMQLLGISSTSYYRNRLTHSLEVAQIARSICTTLSRKYDKLYFWRFAELFVVETISLAHDIGNPPFGHAGEAALDDIAADFGGFEGNAQTFRILAKIERKFPDCNGLNLSKRTMLGLVKYCRTREESPKKFLYQDDYKKIKNLMEKYSIINEKTIDCQVMDLADEIAYGAHDLEDSLHQRFINPYDLIYSFKNEFKSRNILQEYSDDEVMLAIETLERIVNDSVRYAEKFTKGDSDDIFETILRKELTSKIVNLLINDIDYIEKTKSLGFTKYQALSFGLKKLLFNAIKNDSEQILLYERIGANVIKGLYDVYVNEKYNNGNALLSSIYRFYEGENDRKRRIIDYIAGMMDQYAIEMYDKFYGENMHKCFAK